MDTAIVAEAVEESKVQAETEPPKTPWEPPKCDREMLEDFVRHIMPSDVPSDGGPACLEFRVINAWDDFNKPGSIITKGNAMMAGWFSNPEAVGREAARLSRSIRTGVSGYITFNPVIYPLRHRSNNELIRLKTLTSDEDVILIRWALIDIDSIRPEGISAKDNELAAALDVRTRILADIPELARSSLAICSGNGGYLLVRLPDYPNDGDKGPTYNLIGRFLAHLQARYGNDKAKIDVTTKNASRIMGLVGTAKCKGTPSRSRPWRLVSLDLVGGIPREQAKDVVLPPFDLKAWVDENVKDEAPQAAQEREPRQRGVAKAKTRRTEPSEPASIHPLVAKESTEIIARARAYLDSMQKAISGQGGHNQTLDAACSLIGGFGLTMSEALPLMRHYNETKCKPQWEDRDLVHKLESAQEKLLTDERGSGYLLDKPRLGWDGRPMERTLRNFEWEEEEEEKDGQKSVKKVQVPISIGLTATSLETLANGWPKRIGNRIVTEGAAQEVVEIDSTDRLFAWIRGLGLDVDFAAARGTKFFTKKEFFEYLSIHCERIEAIETLPHFPMLPGIEYIHNPLSTGAYTGKLDEYVGFYNPANALYRELIRALILTLFWGGRPGGRPAFLIQGEDEDKTNGVGSGKTTLTDAISTDLGVGLLEVGRGEDMGQVRTRLLSPQGAGARILRLDNVKSAVTLNDLEGFVTAAVISGRKLYSGEGQRPNTVTVVITYNSPSVTADMAQRLIVIELARPKYNKDWDRDRREFAAQQRAHIISDIGYLLSQPAPSIDVATRWADWERDVLSRTDPSVLPELQRLIVERQEAVDGDDDEKHDFREFVADKLDEVKYSSTQDVINIPSANIADWFREFIGRKNIQTNEVTRAVKQLQIPELTHSNKKGGVRGWTWVGINAGLSSHAESMRFSNYGPRGPSYPR